MYKSYYVSEEKKLKILMFIIYLNTTQESLLWNIYIYISDLLIYIYIQ